MSVADYEFWTSDNEYHELARQFEEHIERHGARDFYECDLNWIGGHCPYCATNVTYYDYRGERV